MWSFNVINKSTERAPILKSGSEYYLAGIDMTRLCVNDTLWLVNVTTHTHTHTPAWQGSTRADPANLGRYIGMHDTAAPC